MLVEAGWTSEHTLPEKRLQDIAAAEAAAVGMPAGTSDRLVRLPILGLMRTIIRERPRPSTKRLALRREDASRLHFIASLTTR